MEKLDNALKAVKKGALAEVRKVKTTTPAGGLRKLLMVLEAALLKDDVPAAFDVLWAIEANKVAMSEWVVGRMGTGARTRIHVRKCTRETWKIFSEIHLCETLFHPGVRGGRGGVLGEQGRRQGRRQEEGQE